MDVDDNRIYETAYYRFQNHQNTHLNRYAANDCSFGASERLTRDSHLFSSDKLHAYSNRKFEEIEQPLSYLQNHEKNMCSPYF